ncbi:MAG: cytochrome c3 family protein [Blastocatellia bacterium]
MKRLIVILFIVTIGFTGRAYVTGAQKNRPATSSKFSKFTHKSHASRVKSLISKTQTVDLNCAYCHGTAAKDKLGKDQHDLATIGYPNHKDGQRDGAKDARTHSSCTECHSFDGAGMQREMCVICHDKLTIINPKAMAANIRRFPNPETSGVSQFYDTFSHGSHVDYYEQYAASTPLKDRVKFFDAKADAKANKGLDKNRFECASCHTTNAAPVTVARITFAKGVKMSAPSHPECFICHFDPKVVSPPKADKPNPKNTFATNCTGCHTDTAKPPKADRPVAGSELAVHWFARQIVNTELNPPAVAKAGAKPPLPFSHKTHEDAIGKGVGDCLSCHATAKTAATFKDFYLEDRKTKEKQPVALSCVDCHKKEMQAKIEGAVTVETAKCNYCHAPITIKAFGAKGVAMPPPSHFGKKAIQPTPTPKP